MESRPGVVDDVMLTYDPGNEVGVVKAVGEDGRDAVVVDFVKFGGTVRPTDEHADYVLAEEGVGWY